MPCNILLTSNKNIVEKGLGFTAMDQKGNMYYPGLEQRLVEHVLSGAGAKVGGTCIIRGWSKGWWNMYYPGLEQRLVEHVLSGAGAKVGGTCIIRGWSKGWWNCPYMFLTVQRGSHNLTMEIEG